MTSQTRTSTQLSRLAIAGAFLLAGLAGTAQAAIAGPPLADNGGPGGGGAVASHQQTGAMLDETARSIDLAALTRLDGPSLVGSGPEREIVAHSDEQQPSVAIAQAPTEARLGQPF